MRILFHGPSPYYLSPVRYNVRSLGIAPSASTTLGELKVEIIGAGTSGSAVYAEAQTKLFKIDSGRSTIWDITRLRRDLGPDTYQSYLASNFDIVMISPSDFIRPGLEHQTLVDALVEIPEEIRLVVLGAGVAEGINSHKISRSTFELCALFNERAAVFGVSGDRSKLWLDEHGFSNSIALGCPSLFLYPLSIAALGSSLDNSRVKLLSSGHLSAQRLNGDNSRQQIDYTKMLAAHCTDYVFQDELASYGSLLHVPGIYNEGTCELAASPIEKTIKSATGKDLRFGRYYYFREMGSWRQACRHYDLHVGDQFHAGVAALQAGTPSLSVYGNGGASELTEFHRLPSASLGEMCTYGITEAIAEFANEDIIQIFRDNYWRQLYEFGEVMQGVGVTLASSEIFSRPDLQGWGRSGARRHPRNLV